MADVGPQLRAARLARGLSLRALARQVGVSASMISQIETGRSRPSVRTLYALTSALGVSMEQVFGEAALTAAAAARVGRAVGADDVPAARLGPLVRPADRETLTLDTGVVWQRLGHLPQHDTDFLLVSYPPGGSSSSAGGLMRHPGAEYGFLVEGELQLTLGFREITLRPGDAVSFDSATPHRYRNDGPAAAVGVWFVVDPGR